MSLPHLRDAAPARPESAIVKEILQYLNRQPGVVAWRQNRGSLIAEYKGKWRRVNFGVPGMSDIGGFIRYEIPEQRRHVAVYFAFEVKRPGWKPKGKRERFRWEEQLAFLSRVRMSGGPAAMVTSVDDVIAVLARWRAR